DYSRASLRRRLFNFTILRNIGSLARLQEDIKHRSTLFFDLLETLTVTVTEMFRDPSLYHSLRKNVLPDLNTWPFIRVWHAGCSTGEEAYSMAIMLHEESLLAKSRIYATDINEKVL